MTKHERLIYYILFILIAAPIEIALSLAFGIANGDSDALWRPLSQALLYLYAFILASETRFRIAQHGHRLIHPAQRVYLNLSTLGVFGLFIGHYCLSLYNQIERHQDVSNTWIFQVMALFLAVTGSVLSYYLIEIGPSQSETAKAA